MKKINALLLCLLFIESLQGTEFFDLCSTQLIKCTLSSRHHNRVAISGKRIKKVIYPEGALMIKIEEESGQIFVQTLADMLPETTISLVTSDGIVQDLELSFANKSSELILIQIPEVPQEVCENIVEALSNEETISEVVDLIRFGHLPEGYEVVDEKENSCKLKRGIYLQKIFTLRGQDHFIDVVAVYKNTTWTKEISEADFIFPDTKWVYLDQKTLKKNEKTWAIICRRYTECTPGGIYE